MGLYNKSEPSYFKSAFERTTRMVAASLVLALVIGTSGWAKTLKDTEATGTDLTELSLEDLMTIEVTSVSKKSQKLADAAAAVFVITQEDIRRSGVTSIPEALRMVPGVQVARIDSSKWAITVRGFNGRFANKLLVLLDGRSVYTPLFSGVYWDVQDTLLEDVDRIEVIRGPGASLWGANAVNGVINIITKDTANTQGTLVTGGLGTEERWFGGARNGGKLGESADYRIYAKYFDRDDTKDAFGSDIGDDWKVARAGFRTDWRKTDEELLTLQGDIYFGETGQVLSSPRLTFPFTRILKNDSDISGGNVLGRFTRAFSNASEMELQLYYDRTEREEVDFKETRNTFDIDFQHRFYLGSRHEIIWGLGYRFTNDDTNNTFTIELDPDSREDNLFNFFVQDDITLIEDRLRLTLGSKFEHNDYTGFEVQPNARILWTPGTRQSVWASVSRAVRTPSRVEDDGRINDSVIPPGSMFPGSPLVLSSIFGDRDFASETLVAYEIGTRFLLNEKLSVDIASFYNDYDNLRTLEPAGRFIEVSPGPPHLVMPFRVDNKMKGETYGLEAAADWRAMDWWQLQLSYTYLQMQLSLDGDSQDKVSEAIEGDSPDHQVSLRSKMDIPGNFEFDWWLRYMDKLPNNDVDSYITLDVRLGWKPIKNLEFSIVGQNLLDNQHPEFTSEFIKSLPAEIERGVYGKITWRF